MSRNESRISKLERDADMNSHLKKNGAPSASPVCLEQPRDLLASLEEAASLVRNDRESTGVAKARTLKDIVSAAVPILPLLKTADEAEDRDQRLREQEVLRDLVAEDPHVSQTVGDYIDLVFRIEREVARRSRCGVNQER